jgi:hypothetical protein
LLSIFFGAVFKTEVFTLVLSKASIFKGSVKTELFTGLRPLKKLFGLLFVLKTTESSLDFFPDEKELDEAAGDLYLVIM